MNIGKPLSLNRLRDIKSRVTENPSLAPSYCRELLAACAPPQIHWAPFVGAIREVFRNDPSPVWRGTATELVSRLTGHWTPRWSTECGQLLHEIHKTFPFAVARGKSSPGRKWTIRAELLPSPEFHHLYARPEEHFDELFRMCLGMLGNDQRPPTTFLQAIRQALHHHRPFWKGTAAELQQRLVNIAPELFPHALACAHHLARLRAQFPDHVTRVPGHGSRRTWKIDVSGLTEKGTSGKKDSDEE